MRCALLSVFPQRRRRARSARRRRTSITAHAATRCDLAALHTLRSEYVASDGSSGLAHVVVWPAAFERPGARARSARWRRPRAHAAAALIAVRSPHPRRWWRVGCDLCRRRRARSARRRRELAGVASAAAAYYQTLTAVGQAHDLPTAHPPPPHRRDPHTLTPLGRARASHGVRQSAARAQWSTQRRRSPIRTRSS